jgi:hypothetical protein
LSQADDFDFGSPFQTLRRFYLKKRKMAGEAGEHALSGLWQARQQEQPGVALPAAFPYRAELVAAGYSTSEDLDGACADELFDWAGLDNSAAKAVLAAHAAL